MEAGRRRSARVMLFLVLVMVFVAVERTAVGDVDGGGGGGGGGGEDREWFLKLWTDGGGEAEEDHLKWEEDDDDDNDDEEDHIMMLGTGIGRPPTGRNVVNVDSFGAVGDGNADDTEAFLNAWKTACSLDSAVFLVPGGRRRYKVGASKFMGPCKEKMIIQIQGTIVAPEEPSEWDPRSPRLWLLFSGLVGARVQGGGVIDGAGSKWWASSCKINKSNPCKPAPTALTIDSCRGVRVRSLRVQNAQQMHLTVSRSRNVRVAGLHVEAPADSPNTDGIHVAESTAVTIQSCRIATGDDCISIANASFNVRMKNIDCGPGHGISIGSLGKDSTFAAVENVVLDTARISRAQNGVRIKTWQGGAGYVRNVRFSNVVVEDVDHPIIIDQFYCDSMNPCHNQTSNVQVSNVAYRNISGTSRRAEAIKFACSDAAPCSDIVLSDINLLRGDGGAGEVQAVCNCATGADYGRVRPAADCLRSSTCGGAPDDHTDEDDDHVEAIPHTEL
ncbi:probable polygalacturonase At1g80170 [Phragmites australis]|uniref:probable polygalacturonase At1g80170 n=1 Tax=Phragmites australis TaxID=29695 RepID=UPI002D78161F|nr:probable polygalacturonase At1g80170 [Phragmites australis]